MASKIILDNSTAQLLINGSALAGSQFILSDSDANSLFSAPITNLNTAWANLESGLSSPNWAYVNSTSAKGSLFAAALRVTTTFFKANIADQNTSSTPTGTYPGGQAFVGGVLLPDGRVFCVPSYSTTARIYDPATSTLTTPSGTYPGSGAFAGGVLL